MYNSPTSERHARLVREVAEHGRDAHATQTAPSRRLPITLCLLLALGQAGCVQLAEVDSTAVPLYAPMVGRVFELKQEFIVRGIKRPDQKSPDPVHIVIMPPPGFGGHLTTDLGRLPAGSRFRIVGVVTHRSKLFPSTQYVVAFDDQHLIRAQGVPVRIYHLPTGTTYDKPATPDQPPGLSETYFRPISAAR